MLPGTPVGDTPILRQFQGWDGKGRQWTERPGLTPLPRSRISSIWQSHIIVLADALSMGGGLVRKQEMNEYSTFDRLYRELEQQRAVEVLAGGESSPRKR